MCSLSSYSRGAILWRQYDSVEVVRGLFKSRRNLSAASAFHIERIVDERNGFFLWLKDIFNKFAEDKSRKADTTIDDRLATATTFNQPEITASMQPADSSDKVDVINQKLANSRAMQSMTKFEYGNIRVEKRDAENEERTCASQQVYAAMQPSCFAAEKMSEREIDSDFTRCDPGKTYRSERNAGAIEFAVGDDFDVASHDCCYTGSRHYYRLPPQRTKQPLLESCVPNRHINVPTRAIAGFASRNSKPPIKEPNTPEKREKRDERKDKKEKKKPIIRADDGESVSVDSSENRAEMMADDNPRSDPDAAFRYEWGVKLAEEQPAAASDSDKFAEKDQLYVTKQLWGVNLKQPKPDIAPQATANFERGLEKSRNASPIFKGADIVADETKSDLEKLDTPSLKDTTAEYLSMQQEGDALLSSKELRRIIETSPDILKETIINDEFNIPEAAGLDTEIAAWQNLITKSTSNTKDNCPLDNEGNPDVLSIRPEAPQPKLDVQAVRSIEDNLSDEESYFNYTSSKSAKIKRSKSPRKVSNSYSIGKKLHTISTQTRYTHQYIPSIIQPSVESLSINYIPINKAKTKCSKFIPGFSTNPDDPTSKIDKISNQQSERVKSKNKKNKSNNSNLNEILNEDEPLLSAESQLPNRDDREHTDIDFAKTLDVIADQEMEISMNQLQNTSRKKKIHPSDSKASFEIVQDESPYKDEDIEDEINRYEKSYTDVDHLHDEDATQLDKNSSIKKKLMKTIDKDAIELVKKNLESNDIFDSDAKDENDDSSTKSNIVDGDYVRLPGDPYPYSRENLDKWHVPQSKNLYNPWKRRTSSDSPIARSTLKNANAYAKAAGEPRDSHAGNTVMETSGSIGDGSLKKTEQANGFRVSSRDQRVVSDCLRGDAADALGLQQWMEAFSWLDVSEKMNELARSGDNTPFRTCYE